jgi:hypothetical protein
MRKTGITYSREHYQKSHENVRRPLMITDLYFPQLQEPVEALAALTIGFWNEHENVMFLEGVKDPEWFKSDRDNALRGISETSWGIGPKVAEVKNKLREVAASLSAAVS